MKGQTTLFVALLIVWTQSSGAARSLTFSIPSSTLLFGTYNDVRVATPDRTQAVPLPLEVGANEGYFAYPGLSPMGDLIGWGFATGVLEDRPKHKIRYALGIYSFAESKWKTYGDFDDIGATSFSSDGSKIAFVAERGGKRGLLVFDVKSETLTNAPYPKGMPTNASISWSPDAKRLAVEIQRGEKNPLVAVLDLDTGNLHPLGEGFDPSWSPNGEWISYYDSSWSKCLFVRPDGKGVKTIRKLRQSMFSYRRFGWGGPVWSPDSRQILLNEMKGDGNYLDVVLVNLESGDVVTKAKNCLPVFGWISYKR